MKYYIDKQFQDNTYKETYYSYEEGAYDNIIFVSEDEAKLYALKHEFVLKDNERFEIIEIEEE